MSRARKGRARIKRVRGPRDRSGAPAIKVAIVGAGMAGLTAALRLAERGFAVTVYESRSYVGGQFSAHTHGNGLYHEHAFHMFLNWYNNFWKLAADVGVGREQFFEPRTTVKYLGRYRGEDEFPRLTSLASPGAPGNVWANLFSGVQPPPDMFLYAYSLIDLLTQRFDGGRHLGESSVDAFMQGRPYASEGSAAMHELTLAKAFANPSYLTSARSYQRFIEFGFRHPEPMLWVLRGDCERTLHRRIRDRLHALGVHFRFNAAVFNYGVLPPSSDRTSHIRVFTRPATDADTCLEGGLPARKAPRTGEPRNFDDVDYVVMAAPPKQVLAVDVARNLRDARDFSAWEHLQGARMASLDLYFTRKIPHLPKEHVILLDSTMGLSFIDNSQAWPGGTNTVLNVVAADFGRFFLLDPVAAQEEIIRELREYVPFDPAKDLDPTTTHFQRHIGQEIFLNEVGSAQWRPSARTSRPWLFQAGAHCDTFIDVTTIEGAVVSGLEAARALQAQAVRDLGLPAEHPLATPIEIVEPDVYPDAGLMALKLLLAPCAFTAKCWSWLNELRSRSARDPSVGGIAASALELMFAPYAVAADWFRTGLAAWAGAVRDVTGGVPPRGGGPSTP